ncbi:UDP-N-acetylglucosamine 1-carboxyvinyltransferase [Desulfomonile tiedjei]|uniref:UDP-N-acetylglucosamine 1-carboxyvinyltransferase n=1 Tax=Desulfomonile tiedjei (strain ATCC 49306 / DSM 6799 / DCB-1) TaxID=706587 RepID=I4C0N1_DESTA|nr:UDP-N-acetylglucosamine 1-carboxyvinyltransferase [Desulfomonile tiedjei]AFM23122.1 UDP-N-acetylglucosamine 1-carboxyvinyltransferase [Desulfomonile tiedjei DSM 6799]
MEKIVIHGGTPLQGTVRASGSKNAALPLMCASLLTSDEMTFHRIPALMDIRTTKQLLLQLGVQLDDFEPGTLRIKARMITDRRAPYELVKTMRASVMVLGPLMAREGQADVSLPGGCAIGARPIDQHLKGLEAMGATIELESGYVKARAKRLRGTDFTFDLKTVTGTENLIMAAALAKGTTILRNCALEPEVCELAQVINRMGGSVSGAGTDIIEIEGKDRLQGIVHEVMADRIEAGTYVMAGAITRGNITVSGCQPAHLASLLEKLVDTGVGIEISEDSVKVISNGRVKSRDVQTDPYPGFATDFQAQYMALMSLGDDNCMITENVFENRFMHVQELVRMGARIRVSGKIAGVQGVKELSGAHVQATDLRASASLILAGLAAKGITEIHRVYHLDRGYEGIVTKLDDLGANIRREKDEML